MSGADKMILFVCACSTPALVHPRTRAAAAAAATAAPRHRHARHRLHRPRALTHLRAPHHLL